MAEMGVDAGGSALKLAVVRNGRVEFTQYEDNGRRPGREGIGEALRGHGAGVRALHVTGVGAKTCGAEIFGLPVLPVPEPEAAGRGGMFLARADEAVVASVGTGTALVLCRGGAFTHLGGTGVGGGTILGLGRRILGVDGARALDALALKGDLNAVDLTIGDLFSGTPALPVGLTAANLARTKAREAGDADWAAGIINLCLQAVGSMATLAARAYGVKTVVLTGAAAELHFARKVFGRFAELYGIDYIIPQNAACATAVGAALSGG